jgi:hypothetical protein
VNFHARGQGGNVAMHDRSDRSGTLSTTPKEAGGDC